MWNGNSYGGYMPYGAPYSGYNGYNNGQTNYIGQQAFAPQGANYAPTAQSQQQTAQQPVQMNTNKIYVTGIEDARTRQLPPNSDFIFLDNDKPLLYRKTVDATGKMDIKAFKISEYTEEANQANNTPQIDLSQFVSIQDFKQMQDEVYQLRKVVERFNSERNEKPTASFKPKKEVNGNG